MPVTAARTARLPAGRCVVMPRMRGALRLILPLAAPASRRALVTAALVALALPGAAAAADKPSAKTLYYEGPSGRFLIDGQWLFKLDPGDKGLSSGWNRSKSRAGWSAVTVPNVWNLGDDSPASMIGGVGWYRKDFSVPDASKALAWAVRFESVNYRSRVWLNGKRVGSNRGAYIPFEFRLNGIKRRGTNRLVIRVDSRRRATDFPPSGLATNGAPTGGWWNYSGLQREVYLKRLDTVDWKSVRVTPLLACAKCTATVRVRATLRNVRSGAQSVRLTGNFGSRRISLGSRGIPGNGVTSFSTSFKVRRPRVWSPASPNLYNVNLKASAGGRTVSTYRLRTGIRSIRVSGDGHLILNGQQTNFRGVGVHEDSKAQGFAVDNAFRRRLVGEVKAVGATLMRTHYPMHPYTHELADKEGVMIWSEVPVYELKTANLAKPGVTDLAAKELEKNIIANQNHPSVLLWSIANELAARPGPTQANYIKAAAREAKALDPSRPVGIAVAGYPAVGCQKKAYAPLDVIGVNEYFGWYPGPQGSIFDRTKLSAYLDQLRACYLQQALMITEFGAEANRDGPVEEKGTYAFQQDFVNFHLGVYAQKTWLSGAIYWALNEFRVRPAWEGGNPRPSPPLHQKGVLRYGDLSRKPAWTDLQRNYAATKQFG
jgi:beta-glucuronidase